MSTTIPSGAERVCSGCGLGLVAGLLWFFFEAPHHLDDHMAVAQGFAKMLNAVISGTGGSLVGGLVGATVALGQVGRSLRDRPASSGERTASGNPPEGSALI